MKLEYNKILLGISAAALFAFLFLFFLNIIETPEEPVQRPFNTSMQDRIRQERFNNSEMPEWQMPLRQERGFRQVPIERLFLSPILLLIAIIPLSYYFVSKKVEEKLEKNMKVISKIINSNKPPKAKLASVNDKNVILKFLNFNERKVLKKLIEEKGAVLQSEISRMEGMNKLKTHRIVKNLKLKGIIKVESFGKTNRIILSDDIKDVILK